MILFCSVTSSPSPSFLPVAQFFFLVLFGLFSHNVKLLTAFSNSSRPHVSLVRGRNGEADPACPRQSQEETIISSHSGVLHETSPRGAGGGGAVTAVSPLLPAEPFISRL